MIFQSGKHAGQEAAYVLLRDPGHAAFIMDRYPDGKATKEFKRLAAVLDAKSFSQLCTTCSQTATRATTYAGGPSLYFWCDDCDVHGMGATEGKLIVVRRFKDVLRYGANTRGEQKSVIKSLAEAKGCPARLTQAAAKAFLP